MRWLMTASFVAQVYSCIYYSVFLATALVPIAAVRAVADAGRRARSRASRDRSPAAIVALDRRRAVRGMPYALNRETLGERLDRDILLYSATLANYLATTAANVIHGGWSAPFGQSERFLFPGVIAIALAALGLYRDRSTPRRRCSRSASIGFVISLGLNSPFYEPLRAVVVPVSRPARAGARVDPRVPRARRARRVRLGAADARPIEAASRRSRRSSMAAALLLRIPHALDRVADGSGAAGRSLSMARDAAAIGGRRSAVRAGRSRCTASHDGLYMFNSTWHWQPIVNGYSGFFPQTFIELAEHTASFPDDRSIAYLKQRGVDLLVIHGSLMEPGRVWGNDRSPSGAARYRGHGSV